MNFFIQRVRIFQAVLVMLGNSVAKEALRFFYCQQKATQRVFSLRKQLVLLSVSAQLVFCSRDCSVIKIKPFFISLSTLPSLILVHTTFILLTIIYWVGYSQQ